MDADIHLLHRSDFYQIKDFRCRCMDCTTSKPEYSEAFSISFVRTGNFLFNVFRDSLDSLDSYTGCVLITKPGYERTVTHVHEIPDQCTIVEFTDAFHKELCDRNAENPFWSDSDNHATILRVLPETELLHFHILDLILSKGKHRLAIDLLVLDLVDTVLEKMGNPKSLFALQSPLKKHLDTLERAKTYINNNFQEDVGLNDIAEYAHISPFHFSRVFKSLTHWTPHQYLLHTRLKYAEILLRDTKMPITDVAFASGFNSLEHFSSVFRKKMGIPPRRFREPLSF